jgi:hypothetical protein
MTDRNQNYNLNLSNCVSWTVLLNLLYSLCRLMALAHAIMLPLHAIKTMMQMNNAEAEQSWQWTATSSSDLSSSDYWKILTQEEWK